MRSVLRSAKSAFWVAWVTLGSLTAYPVVTGYRPVNYVAIIDCVAIGLMIGAACFLAGRTVERRAMRRKIEAIMDSVDVPPMLRVERTITDAQAEAVRKRFEAMYALGGVSYLGHHPSEDS